MRRTARPLSVATLVASGLLALLATSADMIRDTTGLSANPAYLLHVAAYWLMFAAAFVIGGKAMDWLSGGNDANFAANVGQLETQQGFIPTPSDYGVRSIASLGGILLAAWSPWLILLYPGVIWYDSRQQLLQYFGLPNVFTDGALSDHHPVFDTMLYGSFVRLGQWLGSADFGAWLFTIVQATLTAGALAATVILARRCGATRRCALAMLAFLAFWPQVPAYASAMAKDATFLPFFLIFAVMAIETMRTRGKSLRSPVFVSGLLAAAMLASLTRKTGVIMVLIVVVVMIVAVRGAVARLKMACVGLLCAVLMGCVMPGLALPALGAKPGGSQEALGLMFQQSSRLLRDHGDELPDWQREAIETTLGKDVADRYSWWITDTVKDETVDRLDPAQLPEYLRAWAAGLAAHPLSYAQTYLAVEYGWFAVPNIADESTIMLLTPIDGHETNHIFDGSATIGLSWTDDSLGKSLEGVVSWLQGTPVGMALAAKAFWSTWMLAFLLVECRRRARGRMAWLAPLVAANLVLWISPTSVTREAMRYLLPMFFLVPLAVALVASGRAGDGRSGVERSQVGQTV